MKDFLYFLPRVLSVIIVVYFTFFLTETTSPFSFGQYPLVHIFLILIVLGITITAWRIPMMEGLIFAIFGVRYLIITFRPGNLNSSLIIFCLFMLTGILFMWEGYHSNKGNKPFTLKNSIP